VLDASGIAPVSEEKVSGQHPVRKLAKGAKFPKGKAKMKVKIKGTPEQVTSALQRMAGNADK